MPSRRIIAVFDSQVEAQNARDALLGLGIRDEEIGILDQSTGASVTQETRGPQGGFWAQLKEMFVPDEDRATIDESIRRGAFVLSAEVSEQRADEAIARMERAGAVDLDQRAIEWRESGWSETSESAQFSPTDTGTTDTSASESASIPVVEEKLRVGKREVRRGGVRARSYVVEEPVQEQVRLRDERVEVERRPMNEPTRPVAEGSPEDLLQDRSVEMTEMHEEPVVGKEAVVTGEVRLKKTAGERVENVRDTVRRTKVEVQDDRNESASPDGPESATPPPGAPKRTPPRR